MARRRKCGQASTPSRSASLRLCVNLLLALDRVHAETRSRRGVSHEDTKMACRAAGLVALRHGDGARAGVHTGLLCVFAPLREEKQAPQFGPKRRAVGFHAKPQRGCAGFSASAQPGAASSWLRVRLCGQGLCGELTILSVHLIPKLPPRN